MIIEIDFLKIERSEVREAVLAAFDLLDEKEKGDIFRDDYGIVCKDNPGKIILEVSDDTDEYTKCFVWQDDLVWLICKNENIGGSYHKKKLSCFGYSGGGSNSPWPTPLFLLLSHSRDVNLSENSF